MEATGKKEVVHSYGWYMRKYISDAKAKGATPIVLSPIPANMWIEGKSQPSLERLRQMGRRSGKGRGSIVHRPQRNHR